MNYRTKERVVLTIALLSSVLFLLATLWHLKIALSI